MERETNDGRTRQITLEGGVGRTAERLRRPRRAFRRRGPVDTHGDPSDHGDQLKTIGTGLGEYRQLVRRLVRARVIQPHDVTITVIDLRTVWIVRSKVMGLKVSNSRDVRAIAVRLVHMLGHKHCGQAEPWRQDEGDDEPTESRRHALRF